MNRAGVQLIANVNAKVAILAPQYVSFPSYYAHSSMHTAMLLFVEYDERVVHLESLAEDYVLAVTYLLTARSAPQPQQYMAALWELASRVQAALVALRVRISGLLEDQEGNDDDEDNEDSVEEGVLTREVGVMEFQQAALMSDINTILALSTSAGDSQFCELCECLYRYRNNYFISGQYIYSGDKGVCILWSAAAQHVMEALKLIDTARGSEQSRVYISGGNDDAGGDDNEIVDCSFHLELHVAQIGADAATAWKVGTN